MSRLAALARPLLTQLDAETAHRLTIRALAALPPAEPPPSDPRLRVSRGKSNSDVELDGSRRELGPVEAVLRSARGPVP